MAPVLLKGITTSADFSAVVVPIIWKETVMSNAPGLAKVLSIHALREIKRVEDEDPTYRQRIDNMDKVTLLEEMVRYQEERTRIGELNVGLMVRGRILFRRLEENAETSALRTLTRSYRRHLEYELSDYLSRAAQQLNHALDGSRISRPVDGE